MAVFQYQALDQRRAAVRGTIIADSPRRARELLRSRGLQAQSIVEFQEPSSTSPRRYFSRYGHAWAMTIHELAMLLRAGTPLLTALDTVSAQQRGGYRDALIQVRDRVAAGVSFSDALAMRPDVFDELSVQLVRVGEDAGTLDEVLRQLAEFKQRMVQLKDQILTALLYPSFVLCFSLVATLFLMTYVLPPLLDSLEESLEELPWPTRIVKAVSDLSLQFRGPLLGGAALTAVAAAALMRTRRGRRAVDRWLLRIPLLGQMLVKQAVSRIAMVVATLIAGGIPLTRALQLAARSTKNLLLRDAIESAAEAIAAGQDVGTTLKSVGVLPPVVVQIFSVGQEAGELEGMLNQLAEDYNRQVAALSARLAAVLEPTLIIFLAMLIGFVLLATILPILEAGNVL